MTAPLLSAAVFEKGFVTGAGRDSKGFLEQLGLPMWTPATRRQHSRIVTRYQTDLTDAEWRLQSCSLPSGAWLHHSPTHVENRHIIIPSSDRFGALQFVWRKAIFHFR